MFIIHTIFIIINSIEYRESGGDEKCFNMDVFWDTAQSHLKNSLPVHYMYYKYFEIFESRR